MRAVPWWFPRAYGGSWGARLGFWRASRMLSRARPISLPVSIASDLLEVRAGLGAVWIDKVNDLNGTHWDSMSRSDTIYRARFRRIPASFARTEAWISKDASNDGWNLIGIGLIF